jgi:hypothetical protein
MVCCHHRILCQNNPYATGVNVCFVQLSAARLTSVWSDVPATAERIFAAGVERQSSFRLGRIVVGSGQEAAEVVAMTVAYDQSVHTTGIDFERRVVPR